MPSTADLIVARKAHRRRSRPPLVRLRCQRLLGESVMTFAFDCRQAMRSRINVVGAPDTIRTCGLYLRRVALYPAELRVHLQLTQCLRGFLAGLK